MLLESRRIHTGRVITLDLDRVAFPDGSEGALEMIRHPGAAAVVPMLDPVTDPNPRVILIRQFRHAADQFIWEIPAGTLGENESPEDCAHRELAEEAGCHGGDLTFLTAIYTAPGFTDELIHLYLATGLSRGGADPEVDEFISIHERRWSEVGGMIKRREIRDAKSLCALMFVHCLLDRSARPGG
jgi:ADP-ribose pyrophosphatase